MEQPRPPRKEKVKVPIRVQPTATTKMELANHAGLPGSFVIALVSQHATYQITVHHPVGHTDLDDADWVATPSNDLSSLLARADDKSVQAVEKQRREAFAAHLITKGLLKKRDDGKIVYTDTGVVRNDRKSEIDKQYSEARKSELETVKAQALSEGKKFAEQKWKPSFTRSAFYTEAEVIMEKKIDDELLSMKAVLAEKFPIKYRTLAGPLANRAQVSCGIAKEADSARAFDLATQAVLKSFRAMGAPTGGSTASAPETPKGADGAAAPGTSARAQTSKTNPKGS